MTTVPTTTRPIHLPNPIDPNWRQGTTMADCTACEHPVIIPEEMKATVTEIHTCKEGDDE